MNTENNLGNVIKEARKNKKKSLRSLANEIGVSHPYLSQLENGRNTHPSKEILLKIAEGLNISFIYLAHLAEIDSEINSIPNKEVIFKILSLEDIYEFDSYEEFKSLLIEKGELIKNNPSQSQLEDNEEEIYKIYKLVLEAKEIEEKIRILNHIDINKKKVVQNYRNNLSEYMAIQHFNDNESTAIFLNPDNEGNFYFFKEGKEIPEEVQEKLRTIIKTVLD